LRKEEALKASQKAAGRAKSRITEEETVNDREDGMGTAETGARGSKLSQSKGRGPAAIKGSSLKATGANKS